MIRNASGKRSLFISGVGKNTILVFSVNPAFPENYIKPIFEITARSLSGTIQSHNELTGTLISMSQRQALFLDFDIKAQPDEVTCGPTCLHALYQYYGDKISLKQV